MPPFGLLALPVVIKISFKLFFLHKFQETCFQFIRNFMDLNGVFETDIFHCMFMPLCKCYLKINNQNDKSEETSR